jgi:hypothetical protein
MLSWMRPLLHLMQVYVAIGRAWRSSAAWLCTDPELRVDQTIKVTCAV